VSQLCKNLHRLPNLHSLPPESAQILQISLFLFGDGVLVADAGCAPGTDPGGLPTCEGLEPCRWYVVVISFAGDGLFGLLYPLFELWCTAGLEGDRGWRNLDPLDIPPGL